MKAIKSIMFWGFLVACCVNGGMMYVDQYYNIGVFDGFFDMFSIFHFRV